MGGCGDGAAPTGTEAAEQNKQTNGDDAAEEALIGGGQAIEGETVRSLKGVPAEDRSPRLTGGGAQAPENSGNAMSDGDSLAFAGREGERHSGEDERGTADLGWSHVRTEEEALRHGSDEWGEALAEEEGQAGADAGQRLEEGPVAEAEADHAAEKEEAKSGTVYALAEEMGVEAENNESNGLTPKVGTRGPEIANRPSGQKDGERKENRGEDGGDHGLIQRARQMGRPSASKVFWKSVLGSGVQSQSGARVRTLASRTACWAVAK